MRFKKKTISTVISLSFIALSPSTAMANNIVIDDDESIKDQQLNITDAPDDSIKINNGGILSINHSDVNINQSSSGYGMNVASGATLNITDGSVIEYSYGLSGKSLLSNSSNGEINISDSSINLRANQNSDQDYFQKSNLLYSLSGSVNNIIRSTLTTENGNIVNNRGGLVKITDSTVQIEDVLSGGDYSWGFNSSFDGTGTGIYLSNSEVTSLVDPSKYSNSGYTAIFSPYGDGYINIDTSDISSLNGERIFHITSGTAETSASRYYFKGLENIRNYVATLNGYESFLNIKDSYFEVTGGSGVVFQVAGLYIWDDEIPETMTADGLELKYSDKYTGFEIWNGTSLTLKNSVVTTEGGTGVYYKTSSDGTEHHSSTLIDSSQINVGQGTIFNSGHSRSDINITNGSLLYSDSYLIKQSSSGGDSYLNLIADKSNLSGDILITSENDDAVTNISLNNAVWAGNVKLEGEHSLAHLTMNDNSRWDMTSSSNLSDLEFKSGVINLGGTDSAAGNVLTIDGDYTGADDKEKATIIFNAVLESDNSLSDKLVVNGNTSGQTMVSVRNIGGQGDSTLNGIEIIDVKGLSDGLFHKKDRIIAGAYDYDLIKKGNNWYLSSYVPEPTPEPGPEPTPEPTPEPGPEPTPDPTPSPTPDHKVRPEAASYIGNLAAANTLFNTRLHDRLGETQYIDALTGEKKVTSLWLRQVGRHNNWRDSSGQLKTQSNSYVAQLGGDVAQWSTDGLNRGHLGLMTGYANSHSQTHSSVTGYDSKGSISGYSAGVYGTWFANDADKSGLYVDSWLQYSWFNNHVNGGGLARESYKSKGLTASLETGYTLKMGEFTGSKGTLNEWFIQPQAQATWMGVEADKHREDNGTRVSSEGDGNVQTRLGMRAYLKSHHAMDEGKGRTFEPFIEANWLHNTHAFSTKMDDVRINQAGAHNIGEVKVGVEGQINSRLNLWGNVGTQVGDKGYNDSTAMIGVKYNF